jgi:TonB family protein
MLSLLLTGSSVLASAVEPAAAPAPYAYHLRIVRVSGAGDGGAALGWAENGGIPVLLPGEEAWGSPEQLATLARTLGGDRADAVTGFFVPAGDGGAHFARRVYIDDSTVDLSFDAVPPGPGEEMHRLALTLDSPELDEPMAEARLLVRTDRTVAVANPSPQGDWLVLAVTLVDQGRLNELRAAPGKIARPEDTGVTPPRIVHKVAPDYPEAARREKIQGLIVLMAVIDREGVPRAPMVLEMSPGTEELAAAAVDAVKAWRYEPATRDGRAVDVLFTVHVKFALE